MLKMEKSEPITPPSGLDVSVVPPPEIPAKKLKIGKDKSRSKDSSETFKNVPYSKSKSLSVVPSSEIPAKKFKIGKDKSSEDSSETSRNVSNSKSKSLSNKKHMGTTSKVKSSGKRSKKNEMKPFTDYDDKILSQLVNDLHGSAMEPGISNDDLWEAVHKKAVADNVLVGRTLSALKFRYLGHILSKLEKEMDAKKQITSSEESLKTAEAVLSNVVVARSESAIYLKDLFFGSMEIYVKEVQTTLGVPRDRLTKSQQMALLISLKDSNDNALSSISLLARKFLAYVCQEIPFQDEIDVDAEDEVNQGDPLDDSEVIKSVVEDIVDA